MCSYNADKEKLKELISKIDFLSDTIEMLSSTPQNNLKFLIKELESVLINNNNNI